MAISGLVITFNEEKNIDELYRQVKDVITKMYNKWFVNGQFPELPR